MPVLLIAEHDNATLKDATHKALSAAKAIGTPVHVLVVGTNCGPAAQGAATLEGVEKVLVADAPVYEHMLAEPAAALIAAQAGSYDATTYPFGIVPVLDISSTPPSTPRLEECVWVHRHEDEGGSRWLVFARIPGRMITPSQHTKRVTGS